MSVLPNGTGWTARTTRTKGTSWTARSDGTTWPAIRRRSTISSCRESPPHSTNQVEHVSYLQQTIKIRWTSIHQLQNAIPTKPSALGSTRFTTNTSIRTAAMAGTDLGGSFKRCGAVPASDERTTRATWTARTSGKNGTRWTERSGGSAGKSCCCDRIGWLAR